MERVPVPGSRWAERGGEEFVVREVFDYGVSVVFDGGFPLVLAMSEVPKWTFVAMPVMRRAA